MNHYHKHALKLSLPLFILLAGCSFPIESKRQITVTTEVSAVSLSATPTSLASPSELPSATILPSFTVTSMPTQPNPILQPSGNLDSLSPSSPDVPNTANVNPNDGSVPSGDQNNQQLVVIPGAYIPPAAVPVLVSPSPVPTVALPAVKRPHRKTEDKPAQPTPITICSACTAD
jgi:hypothetical protein